MEVHESASRLMACPRLSRERKIERRRAIQPLNVNWRERVETNGQVYISISSDEEEKEEDAGIEQRPPMTNTPAQEYDTPAIVMIDSSSDEDILPVRVKKKVDALEEMEEEDEQVVEQQSMAVAQEKNPRSKEVSTEESVVSKHQKSFQVRKRRLGEEDAAFLLFYGDRETPSANILRLIIDLISTGVGVSNGFFSRFIKYLLWCKLSSAVEAGLANERVVQSEWTKIIFSCSVPAHRRRSGPMPRPNLLPRPITITAQPFQLTRKQSQRRNLCIQALKNGAEDVATSNSVLGSSERREVNKTSVKSVRCRPSEKSPLLDARASQTKSPRGKVRKSPLGFAQIDKIASSNESAAQYAESIRRKKRRLSGQVSFPLVTPNKAMHAKSPSIHSITSDVLESLTPACRTLGSNLSLPFGWRPPGQEQNANGAILSVAPVEVNPMLQMTADEIAEHIASVRQEGRLTSFEKVTDILMKLMSDPRNRHGIFNTPVDPIALDLPTYTSIVQHPMDLGTIKQNLSAGTYLELEDFICDVRLVFKNAMLFNPESHYIHLDAQILLRRFNESVKTEQNRQAKRQCVQHVCRVCRGNSCIVCNQQCLDTTPPHLQCSGGCVTEIRKGSVYFITKDGTRIWCQKCKTRLARGHSSADQAHNDSTCGFLDSLIKKKCEVAVEPWVKCGECDRWLHQICGLYNPVIGAYTVQKASSVDNVTLKQNSYVCPLCRCRRKRATLPPKSSLRKILHNDPDELVQNTSCLNIPSCELSAFVQNYLRHGLNDIGEHEAAQTLYVRALSFPGECVTVPQGVVRTFDENARLLAQLRPDTNTNSQRMPAHISYLSRGLYLFQKHEGMEVCLFTIYAQEFGDECELEANKRAVYIAYIDSVRYLKPTSARTAAYHLILLAYFDYLRRHGFSRVHIWSCPPQKRISYVFWCRPSFQKTPSAEHLRRWYSNLLTKAKECGIVKNWTTLYERYFCENKDRSSTSCDLASPASSMAGKEKDNVGVSTRGTTVLSVNPDELVWPVHQLPPIFDGDIIPSELERILGRIILRNEKQKRANENKKNAICGKNSSIARTGGKISLNSTLTCINEAATSVSPSIQVDVKVREVFLKCQFAVQRLKNDLLVVDLEVVNDDEIGQIEGVDLAGKMRYHGCHPEKLVPSWYEQVPRFFGSRFMFHQLCSLAGYQFDTLRRAKHSTMMMVHHYFNEQIAQLNVFCCECSLLITRADFWSCRDCIRFALCDYCYQRNGHEHPHTLNFGPAPLTTPTQVQQIE
ncbi:hypothetical protein CCR75_001373 [Bremia lactucae]|uniref:histone acetyltransferase n=1 Tax=Bremia lactucae TaxID=4779 RepID=A0A976FCS8_BRELC|nr:hypothetical protein CCR75_001373 [Bremia lactucae]